MKLTTRIKLHTDSDSHALLLSTMKVFNAACQVISNFAFEKKCFPKRELQKELYYQIRGQFPLSAQLTILAIVKVANSYTTQIALLKVRAKKWEALSEAKRVKRKKPVLACCKFKDTGCVVYDRRLLSYQHNNAISINTLEKRIKLSVDFSPYLLVSSIKGEADLILQDNVFYLMQTFDIPTAPLSEVSDYLGVDLGQVHIAVDSEGTFYNNSKIETKRVKSNDRRNSLKKVKTKNSRRALKKMSRKQARFVKDVNHCISKSLVQKAKALGIGISLEALEDFAPKKKVRLDEQGKVKKQSRSMGIYRAKRHSWSFRQLRDFVSYKARREGIPLVFINSKYTSQECSVCHFIHEGNRASQACFCCLACGHWMSMPLRISNLG